MTSSQFRCVKTGALNLQWLVMRANMLIVKSIKQIKLTFEKAIALCFMNGLEACSTGYKSRENSHQIDIEEIT